MAAKEVVRRIISASTAPAAVGPYNQAVAVNNTVYLAGQIGLDPTTGNLVSGGATAEARQALINLGEVLKAAGASYNSVVKTTVLLADMADYADVNKIYCEFFTSNQPARAAYQPAALPKGARFEIEAVAISGPFIDQ